MSPGSKPADYVSDLACPPRMWVNLASRPTANAACLVMCGTLAGSFGRTPGLASGWVCTGQPMVQFLGVVRLSIRTRTSASAWPRGAYIGDI